MQIDLTMAPKDKIFGLMELFNADMREAKINLISGVYRDEAGTVPILSSVKEAERRILENEVSKDYLGIAGSAPYNQHVLQLLLNREDTGPFEALQTPGGTGALRLLGEFIRTNLPSSTIWVSNPTWANHVGIYKASGLAVEKYSYYDFASKTITFDDMMDSLDAMQKNDFLLLHGCCHNPTGADLAPEHWEKISELLKAKGCYLILDCAYIGFAQDLAKDVDIIRYFTDNGNDVFVASSFSKNFGLYNERIGALSLMSSKADVIPMMMSHMKKHAREMYSNPPAHGSSIVNTILSSDLRAMWENDLSQMNQRLKSMREKLGAALSTKMDQDFSYIQQQNGLFSFINLSPEQVASLRDEHGVYILASGRINVAGLTSDTIESVATAISKIS